jgi:hypothetical protein
MTSMPIALQHLLVLALVTVCVTVVAWQGVRSLAGKRSRLGSCCAKGCRETATTETGAAAPAKPQAADRVVFFPAENLVRRR